MPWKVTQPMQECAKLVALFDEGLFSMSELCQRFGISRRTGYKWLERYKQHGIEGLKDQSSKPHSSPKQTCAAASPPAGKIDQLLQSTAQATGLAGITVGDGADLLRKDALGALAIVAEVFAHRQNDTYSVPLPG